MTGRSWRHFSIFWPFMVAGMVGPRDAPDPAAALLDGAPVAPTGSVLHTPAAESRCSGSGSDSDSDSDSDDYQSEIGCRLRDTRAASKSVAHGEGSSVDGIHTHKPARDTLPGANVVNTRAYVEVFGSMSIHDAILDTFCRAARLGGALFGDNISNTTALTGAQISQMDAGAHELGVDCVQTLYGHVNTTKLHRLVQHLGDELRSRGNLWEGDTSENERRHASCKPMFNRSNKRGPGVALQMMRCDEAQSAVLSGMHDDDDGNIHDAASDDEDGGGGLEAAAPKSTADLPFTGRGTRVALGDVHVSGSLAKVGELLGMADNESLILHNTARIFARFEWGAPGKVQHLRGSPNFMDKPWFSYVRYEAADGTIKWGRVRLVVRALGRERRSCVVLQRMRPVAPRHGCVLSRYGCQRLAWDFHSEADEYPALALIDATRILRAEDVQVDWWDLTERLGLLETPANKTIDATERRAARYFTNPFFPWTSRELRPGL